MPFNILDLLIVIILLFFVLTGAKRGFVITFFNFFSFIISLVFANMLYPVVSNILRNTGGLYEHLKTSVAETIGLNEFIQQTGKAAETQFINSMSLPALIKHPLIENNNPEIYKLLNVSGLEDYICGFIANLFISAISMIVVFVLVFICIKVLAGLLNILTKLPIINSFNKTGGAIVGLFQGILLLWIIIALSTVFFTQPLYDMIEPSVFAKYFYDNNIILNMLLKLFS